jgi:acetoin utilization deacetylase AcuC-like enzyme
MLLSWNEKHKLHDGLMNENSSRLSAIVKHLQSTDLWSPIDQSNATPVTTQDIINLKISSSSHFQKLAEQSRSTEWFCPACTLENKVRVEVCRSCGTPRQSVGAYPFVIPKDTDLVYLCEGSLIEALHNCTSGVDMVKRVAFKRESCVGMVLSRPPGHHAMSEKYGSYCLINTVIVAAAWFLDATDNDSRVLILDWDVHHGDGTQDIILNGKNLQIKERSFFVSIHRHDQHFWPSTGLFDEGNDHIFNIPLFGKGFGDRDYLYIFHKVVLPLIAKINPKLLLISTGFNCARGDDLGSFDVTPKGGFGRMTELLLETGIPVVMFLEGGYDVEMKNVESPHESLCLSVEETVRACKKYCCGIDDAGERKQKTKGREETKEGVRTETVEIVDKIIQRMLEFNSLKHASVATIKLKHKAAKNGGVVELTLPVYQRRKYFTFEEHGIELFKLPKNLLDGPLAVLRTLSTDLEPNFSAVVEARLALQNWLHNVMPQHSRGYIVRNVTVRHSSASDSMRRRKQLSVQLPVSTFHVDAIHTSLINMWLPISLCPITDYQFGFLDLDGTILTAKGLIDLFMSKTLNNTTQHQSLSIVEMPNKLCWGDVIVFQSGGSNAVVHGSYRFDDHSQRTEEARLSVEFRCQQQNKQPSNKVSSPNAWKYGDNDLQDF